ncbi:ATP synthase complex assembly protein atp12 [Gaertneriomyces sp. JEL0708]|nr:ATP synthase complex assembly protein atp12 [Gaertneriomyces sp. JEL0708]
MRRFWKSVGVKEVDGTYHITLDGRAMKTPDGRQIAIPSNKKVLALLVAGEWEGQDKLLKSYSLPLTSVVVRSIDGLADATTRQGVIDNLLRYLHTDSVCYYQDYPESFVKMQDTHWRPLIDWLKEAYDMDVKTTHGIMSVKQPEDVVAKCRAVLEAMDAVELAAFEKAVLTSKSFIIALALVKRRINVDAAAKAARLEVLHQIDRWGEVEDSHDVDREELRRQLGSVACTLLS